MSAAPEPDRQKDDEHRKKMRAFYAKVAGNGITLIPDEEFVPKQGSAEPPKPAPASEDVKPGHP